MSCTVDVVNGCRSRYHLTVFTLCGLSCLGISQEEIIIESIKLSLKYCTTLKYICLFWNNNYQQVLCIVFFPESEIIEQYSFRKNAQHNPNNSFIFLMQEITLQYLLHKTDWLLDPGKIQDLRLISRVFIMLRVFPRPAAAFVRTVYRDRLLYFLQRQF